MKRVTLVTLLALVLLLTVGLGVGSAGMIAGEANFAFIPNAGEASVSKVDLANGVAIARYYTAPRQDQEVDAYGESTLGAPFGVDPYDWRTGRLGMDKWGNAWAVNTGADFYTRDGLKPGYSAPQGTLAFIEGDAPVGNHASPMDFGSDPAVKVFPVGAPGDIPRTVNFDSNGDMWVGFHMAHKKYGYFQKYQVTYDVGKFATAITAVDAPVTGGTYDIAPYNAEIDKNGILWFASYGSTQLLRVPGQTYGSDYGMYSFNTGAPNPSETLIKYGSIYHGYGILIDNGANGDPVKVYATDYDQGDGNRLWVKVGPSAGDFVVEATIPGAKQLRGLAFDSSGIIWMASSGNSSLAWYNPAGGAMGVVAIPPEIVNTNYVPVGVGMDAFGFMWAVCRNDSQPAGFVVQYDPRHVGTVDFQPGWYPVDVGYRPYAYGNFTPPTYSICGHKYAATDGLLTPLAGWKIVLEEWDARAGEWVYVAERVTEEDGTYCFTSLTAGQYRVSEESQSGWEQVFPDTKYHEVILPEGATDLNAAAPLYYDFHNRSTRICSDDTVWAAEDQPGQTRFVDEGDWATWVMYTMVKDGSEKTYPLYAGQTHLAGELHVKNDADGNVSVRYVIFGGGDGYKDGYCGEWSGLTDYHLQVVGTFDGFNPYRNYNKKSGYGAPIPGSFDLKMIYDEKTDDTGWIEVGNFSDSVDVFIAAHGVAWWCGSPYQPDEGSTLTQVAPENNPVVSSAPITEDKKAKGTAKAPGKAKKQ